MDKVMAQLEGLVAHYEELQEMMADPEVINDTKRYMEISKEEADLREVVQKYKKYKEDKKEIEDNKEIISSETDPDLIEMAKEENSEIENYKKLLDENLKQKDYIPYPIYIEREPAPLRPSWKYPEFWCGNLPQTTCDTLTISLNNIN